MNFSVIKNAEEVVHARVPAETAGAQGVSSLRRDVLQIFEAGYQAILTKDVIEREVSINDDQLMIDGQIYTLSAYRRILFIGIGKCALDAGEVFEEKLGRWLTDGIILDVRGAPLRKLRTYVGTHPFPSHTNMEVTESIVELLEGLDEHDLLITVVSGGGSALLCLPHDITCETAALIAKTLMEKGATIEELNTVRKHTSNIQGGQFAKLAHPATVAALIFSDVPGNDIGEIASGPTVLDTTTVDDARTVLEKYDIEDLCKLPECNLVETPKDPYYFERVHNILLVTNLRALEAMKRAAEMLGYVTTIEDSELQGDAYGVGERLARAAVGQKRCRLYGGETTVSVAAGGMGGRCQEAVLGALPHLGEHTVFAAAASDGWDNTPFAGALGDRFVYEYARASGLFPTEAHEKSRSFDFFKKTGTHIDTGRTGANVSDWYATIIG